MDVSCTLPRKSPVAASIRASKATSCTIFTGPDSARTGASGSSDVASASTIGDRPVRGELHRADLRPVSEHAVRFHVERHAWRAREGARELLELGACANLSAQFGGEVLNRPLRKTVVVPGYDSTGYSASTAGVVWLSVMRPMSWILYCPVVSTGPLIIDQTERPP